MKWSRVICFILLYILSTNSNNLSAQDKLSERWIPNPSDSTYENIIAHLEQDYQLSFSYSPNILDLDLRFPVGGSSSIKELFDKIFIKQKVEYDLLNETRVLLYRRKSSKISISGVIRDFDSKETIPQASITLQETGEYTLATDEGYFYFESEGQDSISLVFSALTYNSIVLVKKESETKLVVDLKTRLDIPEIIIRGNSKPNDFIVPATESGISPLGIPEITEKIKNNPMVQNGNEGQTGFVVKGGAPDENLILMDGMPVYNVSHIGGLSSIFVSSAVKDVKLHTSGISAEYGGKLSSVMDLKIKDGNTQEVKGNFTTGLAGAEAHIEGPIVKNKTALSLSGRFSWLNQFSTSFFEQYEDTNINYYDAYAKLHHKFSPTNRLSLSYYRGNDQLFLLTESEKILSTGSQETSAAHDFNWGNELLSLQWNWLAKDNLSVSSKLGFSKYNLRGTGVYNNYDIRERDVYTDLKASSEIQDLVAGVTFDIYDTTFGKLKFGTNTILHSFKPELLETEIVAGIDTTMNGSLATTSDALEVNAFIQNEIELGENISFRGGLHISNFSDQDTSYNIIEPRLKFSWQKEKHLVDLNLSINHQYIHLLTNPGTGLPSDLWVPSSKDLSPSRSQEVSLDYKVSLNENWSLQTHGYMKFVTEIKSYGGTSDIVFALLGENATLGQFVTSEPDWRDRVEEGKGYSSGIGVLAKYESKNINFLASYTFNYTSHLFPSEEGYFFARHHRPVDILCQINFKISDRWSASTKFVYGSGIRYTFADTYIPETPLSGVDFTSTGRNRDQIDDFHHLDVNLRHKKKLKNCQLIVNVGAYNVYNRQNIFFTYLNLDNDLRPQKEKLGIIRLLPNASVSISF